jgi:hypothetical protein
VGPGAGGCLGHRAGADIDLFDDAGRPVATIEDVALRSVDPAIIAAEVHRLTAASAPRRLP